MKSKALSERLKEVLTSGSWVTGSNFKAVIEAVTWKQATTSYKNLNSIAALTFHVHYYISGVAHVLEGGDLIIKDAFSFDAPEINSQQDWDTRIALFTADAERFISLVEKLTDSELEAAFVDPKYGSLERNIDVLIEHSYYHFGQVVLIKKLLD